MDSRKKRRGVALWWILALLTFGSFAFAQAVEQLAIPPQAAGDASFMLRVGQTLSWTSEGEFYSLKLQSLLEDRALLVLTAGNESLRFSLLPGKTLNIDITHDKQADGSLTLVKLEKDRVELRMRSGSNTLGTARKENTDALNLVLVIVLLLLALVLFLKRKKKRRR